MTILVGTSSWTDKSLVACARFYPRQARRAGERLPYISSQFPPVEADSSYYAMPSASTAQLWAERTPAGFVFNVKVFRLFTGHQTSPAVLHKDLQAAIAASAALSRKKLLYYRDMPSEMRDELWRRFIEALAPLNAAGKLRAVLFQFAPWILRNREGHEHVAHCVQTLAGHTLAVEFRNRTWLEGEHAAATLAFERELNVVHVVVDGPQGFANSVPAVWEATRPDLAILRLHGRNRETWNQKGLTASSERFNYDYSDPELAALVPRIRELANRVGAMHVVFNNNFEDQGQRNARTLMRLLAA